MFISKGNKKWQQARKEMHTCLKQSSCAIQTGDRELYRILLKFENMVINVVRWLKLVKRKKWKVREKKNILNCVVELYFQYFLSTFGNVIQFSSVMK